MAQHDESRTGAPISEGARTLEGAGAESPGWLLSTGGDELLERSPNRSDGCPAGGVIAHHQGPAECIFDLHPDFLADQHASQVVPRSEGIGVEVDKRVETSIGDGTEVECCCAETPKLSPAWIGCRKPVDRNHRQVERNRLSPRQHHAVDPGATASGGVPPHPTRVVMNDSGTSAPAVDDANTRRKPGKGTRRVRRAVERIEHSDRPLTSATGLLTHHVDARITKNPQRCCIGCKVACVLAVSLPRQTPIVMVIEHVDDSIDGGVEHGEEVVVGHGGSRPHQRCCGEATGENRGRLRAMAVIDLQGFVADLKDHVAEHGFHVHDERHFIETYTNRQTWEIDLHPDRACDGPLDMHMALEVDPRTLIAFEDEVIRVGEDGEPDETIAIPVTISFALPPLPAGPDLLVLATELAGIGSTELPLEVSAVDSFAAVTDAPERAVAMVARVNASLGRILLGREVLCEELDRCQQVAEFLLDRAPVWLDDTLS